MNGKRQPNNFKLVSGYVVQVGTETKVKFSTNSNCIQFFTTTLESVA